MSHGKRQDAERLTQGYDYPHTRQGGGRHDRKSFTRAKIVWCANHGVNPSDVPYDFAFKFGDDGVVVEMFSDKVQEAKKKEELPKTVREDYRMMLGFASIAIRVIDGDKEAEAQAFSFLNSYRAELVHYALGVQGCGGVSRAKDYADDAINIALHNITDGRRAIANPVGMMKLTVRRLIKKGGKVIRTDFESRHVTKKYNLKTE